MTLASAQTGITGQAGTMRARRGVQGPQSHRGRPGTRSRRSAGPAAAELAITAPHGPHNSTMACLKRLSQPRNTYLCAIVRSRSKCSRASHIRYCKIALMVFLFWSCDSKASSSRLPSIKHSSPFDLLLESVPRLIGKRQQASSRPALSQLALTTTELGIRLARSAHGTTPRASLVTAIRTPR